MIEPFLTEQWYVDAAKLARPALAAVRGRTLFVPQNWEATYFNWMENIQPWCISRQLWWGHQIPAWYGFKVDGEGRPLTGGSRQSKAAAVIFAPSEAEAIAQARKYYGAEDVVEHDRQAVEQVYGPQRHAPGQVRDLARRGRARHLVLLGAVAVLDLGWPDETKELTRYPTDALVTGNDIIFFWVARMMMMALQFMEEVPFHRSTFTSWCATRRAPRCRSRRATSSIRST